MLATRTLILTILAAAALTLGGCSARSREGEDCPNARATPSGFCVPRWLSLRSNEVLARRGPGFDYPALWTYRAKGLPVQVVAETADWRRICDPEGGLVWVHRTMVGGRRGVMAPAGSPLPLFDNPRTDGKTVALLGARSLADLDHCEGGWCRVNADGASGWAPQSRLWGVAEAKQCR